MMHEYQYFFYIADKRFLLHLPVVEFLKLEEHLLKVPEGRPEEQDLSTIVLRPIISRLMMHEHQYFFTKQTIDVYFTYQ